MTETFKSLIDTHCHILPGIDDGPRTLEESLAIARLYVEAGFRTVVATPHCVPGTRWMQDVRIVRDRITQLRDRLRDEGLLLRVHSGMEIAMDPLVPRLLGEGRLLTLGGGPYVLLECPFQRLPLGWEGILTDISRMGYEVLLAHPERCAQLAEKPGLVDDIVATGCHLHTLAGSADRSEVVDQPIAQATFMVNCCVDRASHRVDAGDGDQLAQQLRG